MQRADPKPWLAAARERIELPERLDLTAEIAVENLVFGVARLLAAVRAIDPRAELRYRASPDLTITRTAQRWRSGFAYGGVLELDADVPVALPELRPNACGTLTGRLSEPLDTATLVRRVSEVRDASPEAVWDYSRRNHFVNLYRRPEAAEEAGDVFVIHGCPASIRADRAEGPGLFHDKSAHWRERLRAVTTPLGAAQLLVGEAGAEFRDNYRRCEGVAIRHREETARRIFGDFEAIQNGTHAGMHTETRTDATGLELYFQGCHLVPRGDEGNLYPVLTRPGEPLYLVDAPTRTTHGYSILPHGTGYRITGFDSVEVITSASGARPVFVLSGGGARAVYGDLSSVPFEYRGGELVPEWQRRGLLRIRETLDMVTTVKL